MFILLYHICGENTTRKLLSNEIMPIFLFFPFGIAVMNHGKRKGNYADVESDKAAIGCPAVYRQDTHII